MARAGTRLPVDYRRLGLEPVSVSFRGLDAAAVRARLERWERRRSDVAVVGLQRLPSGVARELAGVYVSLRERHPDVSPGVVDFAARDLDGLLGRCTPAEPAVAARIELSACLGHPRCVRRIRRAWTVETSRAAPPQVAPTRLSEAALVLVHEFGHLVDDHLHRLGRRETERVYGALSLAAFRDRRRRPRPGQWTAHLVNYPTADPGALQGPAAGGPARARVIRAALAHDIGTSFGRYATTSREELFAEAFTAMYGTPDRELFRRLKVVRRELETIGVARRRRG
jgi:hypothetical protein